MIAVPPYTNVGRNQGNGTGWARAAVLVGCGRSTEGLRAALEEEGLRIHVREASGPALDEIPLLGPQFVLVGAHPGPGRDAFHIVRELGSRGLGCILFLADRADRFLASRALAEGAADVIPPPHSVSAILLRAHVSARRRQEAGGGSRTRRVRMGRLAVDLDQRRILDGTRPVHLTGREFELLMRLMDARGGVVRREALLEDIWGEEQGGGTGVLDATVHRLRRKLEEDLAEPRLVTTVRGVGYRLEAGASLASMAAD